MNPLFNLIGRKLIDTAIGLSQMLLGVLQPPRGAGITMLGRTERGLYTQQRLSDSIQVLPNALIQLADFLNGKNLPTGLA